MIVGNELSAGSGFDAQSVGFTARTWQERALAKPQSHQVDLIREWASASGTASTRQPTIEGGQVAVKGWPRS